MRGPGICNASLPITGWELTSADSRAVADIVWAGVAELGRQFILTMALPYGASLTLSLWDNGGVLVRS